MEGKWFQNEDSHEEIDRNEKAVFYLVGRCLTEFQSIEDHLYDSFLATLPGSNMLACSIFEVAKSLEDKLRLITAATTDRENELGELWSELRPKIKSAADKRNQIAHTTPVTMGRGPHLARDEETQAISFLGYAKEFSSLELRKRTRSGTVNLTEADLRSILTEYDVLWYMQQIYNTISSGDALPKHFQKVWPHPIVVKWPTK